MVGMKRNQIDSDIPWTCRYRHKDEDKFSATSSYMAWPKLLHIQIITMLRGR